MFKSSQKHRGVPVALVVVFLLQACIRIGTGMSADTAPTAGDDPGTNEPQVQLLHTPTARASTSTPTAMEIPAMPTTKARVTITAIKGNLFIRRGPDMAFNPIGVLYTDISAEVTARDVLSKWVQIVIPDSKTTGWVSIQTIFSQIDGDISNLPEVTPTEWPLPAYLQNCTYHDMYILPGEITIPSYLFAPENEIWIYPGSYKIIDLDAPSQPEVMEVDIREGSDIEIQVNGLGEKRICP